MDGKYMDGYLSDVSIGIWIYDIWFMDDISINHIHIPSIYYLDLVT